MSVVINILALIGFIIIIVYLVHYLWKYIKYKQDQTAIAQQNPPSNYLQNSGLQCPDYWVNTGIDSNGNYICKNSFNIDSVQPKTGSFVGKCSPAEQKFSPIASGTTWESGNPNNLQSLSDQDKYTFLTTTGKGTISRCDWINNCGPTSNIQGVWSGVNELCNNPPSTSS
jgi:hypothetical protein